MQQSTEEILKLFVVFSTIFVLLGVVFLILFSRFTKAKNQILKEKFEKEVMVNRTELLALRSQMNPHFVFNALNTLQFFIQLNDFEQSERFLSDFSKLVRNFFEYARKADITLKEEIDFIRQYLEIERIRFEDKLDFEISVEPTIDVQSMLIPTMILQPIVENSINHGIFHKLQHGFLLLNINREADFDYKVIIEDNGIGIKESMKLRKNTTKKKRSHSTDVIMERLQLLKESKQWNIDYKIDDISDSNPNRTGTRVTLKLKFLK